MYYVYLLRSKRTGKYYIGYTNNLRERFRQHNEGESLATKSGVPYELIYYEAYRAKKDALIRERKLKHHAQGFRRLKERLEESMKIDELCEGRKVRTS